MKYIFAFFFFFVVTKVVAQNCNCGDNFSFMVQHIKKNYVGYADKVSKYNQKKFEYFTDSLQKTADKTESNKCISVCKTWLNFFKDQHITVAFNENNPKEEIMDFFSSNEKTDWTEDKLKTYLSAYKIKTDNIEGIWSNSNNSRTYGIVRDSLKKDNFIGFIIKGDGIFWIPQQIKFNIIKTKKNYEFKTFLAKDHSNYNSKITIDRDTVEFTGLGKLYKNDIPKNQSFGLLNPRFKKLDSKTSLVSIPSFAFALKKEIDSLMIKNDSILKDTEHLIIDVRNNPGGSASAFEKILPYLYTNPILTEGAQMLVTDDNIKDGYERLISLVSDDEKERYKNKILKLKAHIGELYLHYPVDTIKYNNILKNPSRVSILINKESVSSAELFILQAKQSTKVKLYGTNSSGSINYLERVETQMPCKFFTLIYPPVRLLRADREKANEGIKPDVEIPADVKDWIKFVRDHKL